MTRARRHRDSTPAALGVLGHGLDHGAHTVADGVVFRARLLLARELCLDPADFRDDIAAFEALDRGVDDFADPLPELGVDLLALRLTDTLGNHLFRRLRGDAPQLVGLLGELDLHADLGFLAVELLRFLQRDLGRRRRHFGDDLLHRIQLDQAGLGLTVRRSSSLLKTFREAPDTRLRRR